MMTHTGLIKNKTDGFDIQISRIAAPIRQKLPKYLISKRSISNKRTMIIINYSVGVKIHSNRARINRTAEICMELFFRTIVTTSCWLDRWELYNSSNKYPAKLNMKGISCFYSPCIIFHVH